MLIRKRERESLVLFSDMVNVSIVRLNKAPLQIILLLYFKFHCMVVCIYFIPNFHISSKLLQELTERESERERERECYLRIIFGHFLRTFYCSVF